MTPTVVIRNATDADLRSIATDYAPGGGHSPWDPFASLEGLQRLPRSGLLVAESDGVYAGFLFWYEGRNPWYAPGVDRFALISELHVVPSVRRHGVGRALLRECVARIRAAGIGAVFLETDENNTAARRLYEDEGFVTVAPKILRYRRASVELPS